MECQQGLVHVAQMSHESKPSMLFHVFPMFDALDHMFFFVISGMTIV